MIKTKYNICQVSLNRDIPLIIENYKNFKKIYKENIIFHIICPQSQLDDFKKNFNSSEFVIINEEEIIEYQNFKNIYNDLNKNIEYEKKFNLRLKWYYQQALKITFVLNFIRRKKENIIIWDADTIILNKISFFKNDISIKYGNFFEFHKNYFHTNEEILEKPPSYFISFLNQFIAISQKECDFFIKNFLLKKNKNENENLGLIFSELMFKSIFNKHKIYSGSLFSEYELIGQSNYLFNKAKQKPILFLRFGLDGKLTNIQKLVAKLLGYVHVTYEHAQSRNENIKMLNKNQSWSGFIRIILKNFFNFYLNYIKHNLMYNFDKFK